MKTQSTQAALEAERKKVEAHRAMPPWRKLQLACELGELENAILWERVRIEFPNATAKALEREFLILIRYQDETNCGSVHGWQDHDGLIRSS